MNMSQPRRQLNLNAFLFGTGHHEASWRLPESEPSSNLDFQHVLEIVQTAERGLLDSVFLADGYSGRSNKLEPFTQLAALASRTKHIGLIATVGTTYNEPFHVARKFASWIISAKAERAGILLQAAARLLIILAEKSIPSTRCGTKKPRSL